MKHLAICTLILGSGLNLLEAQPPPPPPPAAPNALAPVQNTSGSITQLNFGPEGDLDGFVLSNNTLVHIPPDWSARLDGVARAGPQVRVSGYVAPAASGLQVMDAQTLSMDGRNFSAVQPSQPAPFAGSGVIRRLNYGPQGEVNGFVLANGTFAKTPPFGASSDSILKPGSNITFSGFVHASPTGKSVVDVQSITVNGQTIALNAEPSAPIGPPRPRGPRGRAAAPPPPPPPPSGEAAIPPPAPPQAQ